MRLFFLFALYLFTLIQPSVAHAQTSKEMEAVVKSKIKNGEAEVPQEAGQNPQNMNMDEIVAFDNADKDEKQEIKAKPTIIEKAIDIKAIDIEVKNTKTENNDKTVKIKTTSAPMTVATQIEPAAGTDNILPESAFQSPETMTLKDMLKTTYLNNPELRAARAALKATQEQLPQAQAGWKPDINAEASITSADISGSNFGNAQGSTAKDVALNINQPIFRGGRTLAQTSAARHIITATRANLNDLEQNIILQAITIYADLKRDKALVKLAKNNANVLRSNFNAAKIRFKYGDLTKTDVAQAESRHARAKANVISAQSDLKVTQARFLEISGIDPVILNLDDKEGALEHKITIPDNLDQAYRMAERLNPRILSAIHTHQAAIKDVNNIFGELLPTIGGFANWNRTFDPIPGLIDETTVRSVGISASIPLYQSGATRSRIRQAKHINNQRFVEIAQIKNAVRQDVTQNWANLIQANGNIIARTTQVKAAELANIGVEKESELGARTILDALDAQQELLDAQTALVTAKRDRMVAKNGLLASIGVLTPKTLGFVDAEIDYQKQLKTTQGYIFNTNVDRLDK